MLAEKFLLLLETLLSRVVDDKPPTVTSTPAAYPPNPLTSAVTGAFRAARRDENPVVSLLRTQ
jgi:hypothetical protein